MTAVFVFISIDKSTTFLYNCVKSTRILYHISKVYKNGDMYEKTFIRSIIAQPYGRVGF